MVVTDQEIANGVENLLRQSNPTSINGLVQQLEAKLGLDLSHKITFIRNHIDLLLRSHIRQPPPQTQPQPPTQPPTQPSQAQQTNSVKDHFALQYQAQFHPTHTHHHQHLNQHHQQFSSSHFALPNHHNHHQHRPEELNFRHHHPNPYNTQPNPFLYAHPQPQQQQQRVLKSEDGFVGNVAAAGTAAGTTAMPKESAPTATKRRGGPGGLTKVCGVSPELQAIVGEPALPRTQIVKQLWAYIRKNNLQDPSNKRKIICDEPLRLVFETDCTDMFKMNKLLAKHIIALEPKKETGSDSKRVKVEVEQVKEVEQEKIEVEQEKVEVESSVESTEAGSSAMVISDALARFLGTEEREMVQSEAVGRVWEHITVNNLTDPIDSMVIICDAKLQELFGCESTSVVGISEMLMSHFFKKS